MKKLFCLVLCFAVLASILTSCAASPDSETGTTETVADSHILKVGYGRADISPENGTPLGGCGDSDNRLSTSVTVPLYSTCIAFTDEHDNTVLLYHLDLTRSYSLVIPMIRTAISKAVGLPAEQIMVSATHTHSAPDLENTDSTAIQNYVKMLKAQMIQAAEDALADRKEAQMYLASTYTENLNFVRHYLLDNGTYAGDNFGDFSSGNILGHVSEADNLMQLVKFTRADCKDIILVNYQGHPHRDCGSTKTNATSDAVGVMREYMENALDCNFAYFSGASGNVNMGSKISEEQTADYLAQGQALGKCAVEAAQNFTQAETGAVTILAETYSGTYKTNASAVLDIPMYAFSIGDVAFAMAPYEMWDMHGKAIREFSAYDMTFVVTYANTHLFYIPAAEAYDYDSYESGVSRFTQGTAELLMEEYIDLLTELYETANPEIEVPEYEPAAQDEETLTSNGKIYWMVESVVPELTPSGYYRVKLMGGGNVKYYLVDGQDLVDQITTLKSFTISVNSLGIIKTVGSVMDAGLSIGTESMTVTAINGNTLMVVLADDIETAKNMTSDVSVYDMRKDSEAYMSVTGLRTGDVITAVSDSAGEITDILLQERVVVKSLCTHCNAEVEWIDWSVDSSLPVDSSGHYRLVTDVDLSAQQNIQTSVSVVLDLNGHTVTGGENKRILALYFHDTYLAILDSSKEQTGKLVAHGAEMDEGTCVWLRYGTFELYSGILDGSQAVSGKNGVVVTASSDSEIFIIYGGTIIGGTSRSGASAGGNGGAVSVASEMIMYDGLIIGGKALAYKVGSTIVRGGLGGNIYIANGGKTFTMYGGTITGGYADVSSDNVYIGIDSAFNHLGGIIE